jgi:Escherichia/Staphylococcus phage prohead protease
VTALETRSFTGLEVRAAGDGRTVTGLVAPFGSAQPVYGGGELRFTETLDSNSFRIGSNCALFLGHPTGEPHNESDLPVSPPGKYGEYMGDGIAGPGLYGEWRISRTPAGDSLLNGIHSGQVTGLSVGFVPGDGDQWSSDGRRVRRVGAFLEHVAAVTQGAYPQAGILEVRAADISADDRRKLAAKGWALPDGSYPIPDRAHLHSAAVLAASGHGDVAAARRLIRKRARDLGVDVTTLPGFGPESRYHTALETRQIMEMRSELMRQKYDPWDETVFSSWRVADGQEAQWANEGRFR